MELAEFRAYAKVSNVIPVSRKLLADSETPLGVYKKLAKSAPTLFFWNLQNMVGLGLVTHLLVFEAKRRSVKKMVWHIGRGPHRLVHPLE